MNLRLFPTLLLAVFSLLADASAKPRKPSAGKTSPPPNKKAAAATPAPAKMEPAYFRVWKGELKSPKAVRVVVTPDTAKDQPVERGVSSKGFGFTDYGTVPSGQASILFSQEDDPNGKPATAASHTFAPGSFSTLLVLQEGDHLALQVIDDSPTGKDPESGEFVVRNFAGTLKEFRIEVGDEVDTHLRASDGMLHLRGLDRQVFGLTITATTTEDKEWKWTEELNFTKWPKVTLLIFADPRGRIRPRLVNDAVLVVPSSDSDQQ